CCLHRQNGIWTGVACLLRLRYESFARRGLRRYAALDPSTPSEEHDREEALARGAGPRAARRSAGARAASRVEPEPDERVEREVGRREQRGEEQHQRAGVRDGGQVADVRRELAETLAGPDQHVPAVPAQDATRIEA